MATTQPKDDHRDENSQTRSATSSSGQAFILEDYFGVEGFSAVGSRAPPAVPDVSPRVASGRQSSKASVADDGNTFIDRTKMTLPKINTPTLFPAFSDLSRAAAKSESGQQPPRREVTDWEAENWEPLN